MLEAYEPDTELDELESDELQPEPKLVIILGRGLYGCKCKSAVLEGR